MSTEHVFLSHAWGENGLVHHLVSLISEKIHQANPTIKPWLNERFNNPYQVDLCFEVETHIKNSKVAIIFLTREYLDQLCLFSSWCRFEYFTAVVKYQKPALIVMLDKNLSSSKSWPQQLLTDIGEPLYVDMCTFFDSIAFNANGHPLRFPPSVANLFAENCAVLASILTTILNNLIDTNFNNINNAIQTIITDGVEVCELHQGKVLSVFDENCQEILCSICAFQPAHKTHTFAKLDHKVTRYVHDPRFVEFSNNITEKAAELIKRRDVLNNTKSALNNNKTEFTNALDQQFGRVSK